MSESKIKKGIKLNKSQFEQSRGLFQMAYEGKVTSIAEILLNSEKEDDEFSQSQVL